MKKYIIALLASVLFLSHVSAGDFQTSIVTEPDYKAVEIDNSLNFSATRDGYKVTLHWNAYVKNDFKYYKIMKSETHANPVYPDQNALNFIDNAKNTTYELKDWAQKPVHYRVCVITTDKARYCSNVVKLDGFIQEKVEYIKEKNDMCIQVIQPAYNKTTGECKNFPTPCKVPSGWTNINSCSHAPEASPIKEINPIRDIQPVKEINPIRDIKPVKESLHLDVKLQQRADTMVTKLASRLDNAYGDDSEKKAEKLGIVIKKLEILNAKIKSEKTKALVIYITQGLKDIVLEINTRDDIEDIFNVLEE